MEARRRHRRVGNAALPATADTLAEDAFRASELHCRSAYLTLLEVGCASIVSRCSGANVSSDGSPECSRPPRGSRSRTVADRDIAAHARSRPNCGDCARAHRACSAHRAITPAAVLIAEIEKRRQRGRERLGSTIERFVRSAHVAAERRRAPRSTAALAGVRRSWRSSALDAAAVGGMLPVVQMHLYDDPRAFVTAVETHDWPRRRSKLRSRTVPPAFAGPLVGPRGLFTGYCACASIGDLPVTRTSSQPCRSKIGSKAVGSPSERARQSASDKVDSITLSVPEVPSVVSQLAGIAIRPWSSLRHRPSLREHHPDVERACVPYRIYGGRQDQHRPHA